MSLQHRPCLRSQSCALRHRNTVYSSSWHQKYSSTPVTAASCLPLHLRRRRRRRFVMHAGMAHEGGRVGHKCSQHLCVKVSNHRSGTRALHGPFHGHAQGRDLQMLRTGGPGSPVPLYTHGESNLTPTIPEDEALEDAALPADLEGLAEVSAAGTDGEHLEGTPDGFVPVAGPPGALPAAATAAAGRLPKDPSALAVPPLGTAPKPRSGSHLAPAHTAAPDVMAQAAAGRPRIPLLPTARTADPAAIEAAIQWVSADSAIPVLCSRLIESERRQAFCSVVSFCTRLPYGRCAE